MTSAPDRARTARVPRVHPRPEWSASKPGSWCRQAVGRFVHDLTGSRVGRTPATGEGRGQWMPTDLGVTVEDRPGGLADIGEALGNAGINIEGLCGIGMGDRGVIHLLGEGGAAARAALE